MTGARLRKGYLLTDEDRVFRKYILDIACKGYTLFDPAWSEALKEWSMPILGELERDGLVYIGKTGACLTKMGRPFMRQVCKAFDLHLLRDEKARGAGFVVVYFYETSALVVMSLISGGVYAR